MPTDKSTPLALAEVSDVTNVGDATFLAKITGYGEEDRVINYTGTEGQISFPQMGSRILISRIDDEWYYISSVPGAPPAPSTVTNAGSVEEPLTGVQAEDDMISRDRNTPDRVTVSQVNGNSLTLYSEFNEDPATSNHGCTLKTAGGNKIELNDIPSDHIKIENSQKDFIKLTGTETDSPTSLTRSLEVHTKADQKYISENGTIDIYVQDGKELNIENSAGGTFKLPDATGLLKPFQYGNVNIQSKYKDVNIFTGGTGAPGPPGDPMSGRIFIECLNPLAVKQLIQIDTKGPNGTIRIMAPMGGKIEVLAGAQGLDIESLGDINMLAAGNINMTSGGEINMKAILDINADGKQIYLNSFKAKLATPLIIPAEQSSYFPVGVTRNSVTPIVSPV